MNNNSAKHLILVAGEASGDNHGSHLVNELKKISPAITFSGLGGPQMHKSGVELYYDMTKCAVVGITEVIKHFKDIKNVFHLIENKIKEKQPDAVIFIDYPGFNLRLAKKVKAMGIKVIYYISPQIWAWREKRVELIKEIVDQMIVLFPFEKKLYAKHGFHSEFVGHPLVDSVTPKSTRKQFLKDQKLSLEKTTIGLLPGSREKEIERILPTMLQAVEILNREHKNLQFILPKAETLKKDSILNCLKKHQDLNIHITKDQYYDSIQACDYCIVTSGTATLETAILQKPMVVVYKTSFVTWALAKYFVKIPHISLANIVAEKGIVPELIQFDATPKKIAYEITNFINNKSQREKTVMELKKIKDSLEETGGASCNAAKKIFEFIS